MTAHTGFISQRCAAHLHVGEVLNVWRTGFGRPILRDSFDQTQIQLLIWPKIKNLKKNPAVSNCTNGDKNILGLSKDAQASNICTYSHSPRSQAAQESSELELVIVFDDKLSHQS